LPQAQLDLELKLANVAQSAVLLWLEVDARAVRMPVEPGIAQCLKCYFWGVY
jgi:hypothetical protein